MAKKFSEIGFCVFDTEATSPIPEESRVCEIGWCKFNGDQSIAVNGSILVNPGIPIPKESYEIHGISSSDVQGLPNFRDQWVNEFRQKALPSTAPIVTYNGLSFDIPLIRYEAERTGLVDIESDIKLDIDLYVFVNWFLRGVRSRKLGNIATGLGISIPDGMVLHGAATDCYITGMIMWRMIEIGLIPDDMIEAYVLQKILFAAMAEEEDLFQSYFYIDRWDGDFRIGFGKFIGKPLDEVPLKEWQRVSDNLKKKTAEGKFTPNAVFAMVSRMLEIKKEEV